MSSEISGANDLTLILTNTQLARLKEVDEVIDRAILTGDPLFAFRWVLGIRAEVQVRGVQVACVLARIEEQWKNFGVDDDFISVAEAETGLSVETIKKYTRLYRQIFGNEKLSEGEKQKLAGLPIRELMKVAPALADGQVSVDDVVNATTEGEINQIVREARGAKTSSETRITILLDRTGQLKVRQGSDGPFEPFGFLHLEKGKENLVVQRAIDRIVQNLGILEV